MKWEYIFRLLRSPKEVTSFLTCMDCLPNLVEGWRHGSIHDSAWVEGPDGSVTIPILHDGEVSGDVRRSCPVQEPSGAPVMLHDRPPRQKRAGLGKGGWI